MSVNFRARAGYGIPIHAFNHLQKLMGISEEEYNDSWAPIELLHEYAERLNKKYPNLNAQAVWIGNPYTQSSQSKEFHILAIRVTSVDPAELAFMNTNPGPDLELFTNAVQQDGFYQVPSWFVGNEIS